ncbi:MAG TPA: phosphotransferase [Acidimicrobiales bacterium]|nr:phosphotransferase [Acidimicrobiales bacterium]
MIKDRDLVAALPGHLAAQRWFGAKDRELGTVEIVHTEVLRAGWPALVRVEVLAAGDRYQLLLGLRPVGEWEDVGRAGVGELATTAGPAFCYDALIDVELGLVLLGLVAPDLASSVESVRPILAEQSNTSLVYDERFILKVFRRLDGANPDVEVSSALADVGFAHVAEPMAIWRSTTGEDLGLLQRFMRGGAEGWALALTSLRDFYADGGAPGEAGGDFSPEAGRLGQITGELHLSLAEAFGPEPGDAVGWAATVAKRISQVHHPDLDQAALAAVVERLASVPDGGRAIRVHGDYHLGQVLRTDEGWVVVDFEGEPARPVDERRGRTSPLRDVAGMLRSFDYASRVAASEHGGDVAALADAWASRNRAAFLGAYHEVVGGQRLVPADPACFADVLAAFELDKAVYEVGYEQAHRPDWLPVALAGVRRLLADAP